MSSGLKKTLIIVGAIVVIVFGIYSFFAGSYNEMVRLDEGVKTAWSQVENVYQRRYDLIPNLVSTVKGYAAHESQLFTEIAEARSKAGGVLQVSDEVLNDPKAFEAFQEAQAGLGASLQRLLAVTENYPELKANENFLALQSQIEGTENRIAVERKRFNEAAQDYNTYIRKFPRVLLANMYGFSSREYFKADADAAAAPKVEF